MNRTKKLSHEKEGLIFSVYNAPPSIIELGMSISSNIDWIASTSTSLIEQDETIGSFTSKLIYKNSLSNKFNYRFSSRKIDLSIFANNAL